MPEPDRPTPLVLTAAAGAVALAAFWAYTRTLLPGVDLGDSGAFQAAAVWRETSGRESYPLYFALGEAFIAAFSRSNPARGLNLFSALWAALAAGMLTFAAGRVVRSAVAGAVAGLFLAFSYTFWTQAITAEVYTLHLALVAGCVIALAAYQEHQTTPRLAVFFGLYAASFANHYAMILLLPPFALFLIHATHDRRALFTPRVVALALGIAAAAALLYAGNFLAVWSSVDAPASVIERVSAFWFDATKADWREAMVLGAAGSGRLGRLAMWWWDARQQFGIAGVAIAIIGAVRLYQLSRSWALLVVLAYLIAAAFAITYNVGDVHVFFLPAHFFTAFAAAAAVAPRRGRSRVATLLAVAALTWAGWRAWDTWPAVDRHDDRRGEQLVARLAQGITDDAAVLVTQIDWQAENALLYASRQSRRTLAWVRLNDVLLHFPFLVSGNHGLRRDIVLTADAAADVVAAFGPYFPVVPDDPVPAPPIVEVAARLPPGTPYVLSILPPTGRDRLAPGELGALLERLTGRNTPPGVEPYRVWAGVTGEPPAYQRADGRPFRERFSLLGDPFEVRMESWLPDDTFRRAGFGRILRGREPVLTVERGVSLVWFRPDGTPAVSYAAGLYALRPRFRIPAQTEQFALCSKSCGASSLP